MKNLNFKIINLTLCSIFLLGLFNVSASAAGGVTLTATAATQTVTVGQTANYTIKINRDGYTDKVILNATGLPAGTTATFTPNTTTANSSTLSLKTSANTPVGAFSINVKATANGITIAPITVKLITNAAPAISISVSPSIAGIIAGQPTFFDVTVSRTNFDGAITFFAENIPSGVTVQFEPPVTTGNSARMYLYSNGLPFIENTFGMQVSVNDNTRTIKATTTIKVETNCGINWAEQFGVYTREAGNNETATAVGYDSLGNLYAAGRVYLSNFSSYDIWIAKYGAGGTQIWLQRMSFFSNDMRATDLAVDAAGNIYVAGYAQNNGDYDVFFTKFDNNGNQLAIRTFGSPLEDGVAIAISVDNIAHTVSLTTVERVNRQYIGTIPVLPPAIGRMMYSVSFEILQREFDSNFNTGGSITLVNNSTQGIGNPKDIAVSTTDGSVYFVGEGLDDANGIYSIIAKFRNGGQLWRIENRAAFSSFTKIAVDTAGTKVFVVDAATDVNLLARDSADGHTLWTQREAVNNGFTINTLTVDGGNGVYYGATNGGEIFFRKRLGSTGAISFSRLFRVIGSDNLNDLKVDGNGILYLAADTYNFTNVNSLNPDALVMKYAVKFCVLSP